jgi:hypothetical protein
MGRMAYRSAIAAAVGVLWGDTAVTGRSDWRLERASCDGMRVVKVTGQVQCWRSGAAGAGAPWTWLWNVLCVVIGVRAALLKASAPCTGLAHC